MKTRSKIALIALAFAPFLLAATSGFPSRPFFQSVTVGSPIAANIPVTGNMLLSTASQTKLELDATSAAADTKRWIWQVGTTSSTFAGNTDVGGNCCTYLQAVRAGTTLSAVSLGSATVTTTNILGAAVQINSAPLFLFKSADESRSNTTTLANDSALATASLPNGTYAFHMYIIGTFGSGTQGIRLAPNGAAGSYMCTATTNTANPNTAPVSNDESSLVMDLPSVAAHTTMKIVCDGHIAGTSLALQWAQSTSSATNSTVKLGSYILLTRLN